MSEYVYYAKLLPYFSMADNGTDFHTESNILLALSDKVQNTVIGSTETDKGHPNKDPKISITPTIK